MTDQQNNDDESPLQGGSYRQVRDENEDGQVHHIPAQGAYKQSGLLNPNDGPSIWMTPEDHRKTASFGNSKEARDYRNQQKDLIDQGRFEDALQMDVDDLRSKFGNTYDPAIQQAQDYYHNELKDRLPPPNSEIKPEPQPPTDEQTTNAQQLANAQLADQLEKSTPPSESSAIDSETHGNI